MNEAQAAPHLASHARRRAGGQRAAVRGAVRVAARPRNRRPAGPRHRAPPPAASPRGTRALIAALIAEHGARFAAFGTIGGLVFVTGLALQAFLVQVCRLGSDVSYVLQGTVSVQLSFLLNYYWTWRDKQAPFWPAWYKFNTQKIITTLVNLLIYAGLIAAGINYLVANIATTAIFTTVNYLVGNFWSFAPPEGKKNCRPPLV